MRVHRGVMVGAMSCSCSSARRKIASASVLYSVRTPPALALRFNSSLWFDRQLKHCCPLTLAQECQEHDRAVRKSQRIVMGGRPLLVDLPEDRKIAVLRLISFVHQPSGPVDIDTTSSANDNPFLVERRPPSAPTAPNVRADRRRCPFSSHSFSPLRLGANAGARGVALGRSARTLVRSPEYRALIEVPLPGTSIIGACTFGLSRLGFGSQSNSIGNGIIFTNARQRVDDFLNIPIAIQAPAQTPIFQILPYSLWPPRQWIKSTIPLVRNV